MKKMHEGFNVDMDILDANIDEVKYYRDTHPKLRDVDKLRLDRNLLKLRKIKHDLTIMQNTPHEQSRETVLLNDIQQVKLNLIGLPGLHLQDCTKLVVTPKGVFKKIFGLK